MTGGLPDSPPQRLANLFYENAHRLHTVVSNAVDHNPRLETGVGFAGGVVNDAHEGFGNQFGSQDSTPAVDLSKG